MTDLLDELAIMSDPFRDLRPLADADQPWRERSCVACGLPMLGWFDVTTNHVLWPHVPEYPFPLCGRMVLTQNHCVYELRCIADPDYGRPDCHCDGARKHAAHPADRLRDHYLPRAKEVWGRRSDSLLAGLRAIAGELGLDFAAITGEAA